MKRKVIKTSFSAVVTKDLIKIISIGIALFSLVALFTKDSGIIGKILKQMLIGLFGFSGYIIPFIVLGVIFFSSQNKYTQAKKSIKKGICIVVYLSILCHLFYYCRSGNIIPYQVYPSWNNGGYVGSLLGGTIIRLLGRIGAFILLISIGAFYIAYTYELDCITWIIDKIYSIKENKINSIKPNEVRKIKNNNVISVPIPEAKEIIEPTCEVINEDIETKPIKEKIEIAPKVTTVETPIKNKVNLNKTSDIRTTVNIKTTKPKHNFIKATQEEKTPSGISLSLLDDVPYKSTFSDEQEAQEKAQIVLKKLSTFGIGARLSNPPFIIGPAVIHFEIIPNADTKINKIKNINDDLQLALAAQKIRIQAPVPGKPVVGIEIDRKNRETVYFKELITSKEFKESKAKIPFALGKDINGNTIVEDVAEMPHLLIAGASGSGKSVGLNTLIMSIICKLSPKDIQLVLMDPKAVELSIYEGIPYLKYPVITEAEKAAAVLNKAVQEMENRYNIFKEYGVRQIDEYNKKVSEQEKMPYIMLVIDEFGDFMQVVGDEVEGYIKRLSQKSRAAGISLVLATQRPSADVITGVIKTNLSTRIAFTTSSATESRIILDKSGAEQLLFKGDMLYLNPKKNDLTRIQCSYVSTEEVNRVVESLRVDNPKYEKIEDNNIKNTKQEKEEGSEDLKNTIGYIAYEKLTEISASKLQRALKIGFNKASILIDQLANRGLISKEANKNKKRDVYLEKILKEIE